MIGDRGEACLPTSITPGVERAAGDLEDQLGAAAAGPVGDLGVERPLEPEAGGAEEARAPARFAAPTWRRTGRPRSARSWCSGPISVSRPAHHAGQADGPVGVGDRQHVRARARNSRPLIAVRVSPRPGAADDQPVLGQAVEVVGVQRLAALEHHVVRDVDDVADRADADRLQPLPQPPWALAHAHSRDDPRREPGAKVGGFNRDGRERFDARPRLRLAGQGGSVASLSNTTAISRAMPMWPRQSDRLLVTSRSMARSPPTSVVDSWFRPVSASRSVRRSTGMSSRM